MGRKKKLLPYIDEKTKALVVSKGPNNENLTQRTCLKCGKEFLISIRSIRRGGGDYCSDICRGNKSNPLPYIDTKTGLQITHRNKYGEACITKLCLICEKEFHPVANDYINTGSRYCSRSCTINAVNQKLIRVSANNIHLQSKAHNIFHKALREGIITKSTLCEICKLPELPVVDKLDAHHEDYAFPLNVIWAHRKCHSPFHIITEEKINE